MSRYLSPLRTSFSGSHSQSPPSSTPASPSSARRLSSRLSNFFTSNSPSTRSPTPTSSIPSITITPSDNDHLLPSLLASPLQSPVTPPSSRDRDVKRSLCEHCLDLDIPSYFENQPEPTSDPINWPQWDLVALANGYKNDCGLCRLILKTIRNCAELHQYTLDIIWAKVEDFHPPSPGQQNALRSMRIYVELKAKNNTTITRDTNRCLIIDPFFARQSGHIQMRRIAREKADAELAKQWLETCNHSHPLCRGDEGSYRLAKIGGNGIRVMDIVSGCIVKAPPDCTYVALSYIWGGAQQMSVTRTVLEALSSPGALWTLKSIPATIKDAVLFCRSIGQRYLWVDSLCILSDYGDRQKQISQMDLIYANATLTIVDAGSTSAKEGLFGVSNRTRKPIQLEETVRIGFGSEMQFVTTTCSVGEDIKTSPWWRRAWTFQEYQLSRRLVIFTSSQIIFQCRTSQWREDFDLGSLRTIDWHEHPLEGYHRPYILPVSVRVHSNTSQSQSEQQMINDTTLAHFQNVYLPYLNEFLRRGLSREDDIIDAFSGILEAVAPTLGISHYGVPHSCFHNLITFELRQSSPLRRRIGFPSWSWAGWKHDRNGHLECRGNNASLQFIPNPLLTILYSPDESGELRTLHGSQRDTTSPYHGMEPELAQQIAPGDISSFLSSEYFDHHQTLKPQHIVFWTSVTRLLVDRESCRPEGDYFTVRIDYGTPAVGLVRLNPRWREERSDKFDFLLLGVRGSDNQEVVAMLVESERGVRYRVNMLEKARNFSQRTWLGTYPQRRMIVLG